MNNNNNNNNEPSNKRLSEIVEVMNFLGWKSYMGMCVAHSANTFHTRVLFTKTELDLDSTEPDVCHYDSCYGYKCSLPDTEIMYVLDREKTSSYTIPNLLRSECCLDTDFRLLMQVVEIIETGGYVDEFNISTCSVRGYIVEILPMLKDTFERIYINVKGMSKAESIFCACLDYVRWYKDYNKL